MRAACSTVLGEHLLHALRGRELACELEQRPRGLGLASLHLVETRVLERHRRLSREHFEQAQVVAVELVEAELRDDDRADRRACRSASGTASSDSSIRSVPGIGAANSHLAASPERTGRPVATTCPVMPSPIVTLSTSIDVLEAAVSSPRNAIGTIVSPSTTKTRQLW